MQTNSSEVRGKDGLFGRVSKTVVHFCSLLMKVPNYHFKRQAIQFAFAWMFQGQSVHLELRVRTDRIARAKREFRAI
jgi:hypothetical protein